MIKKDKEVFDVELSLCILKDRGDKTVGSVGILRDITKLKKIERELFISEEMYDRYTFLDREFPALMERYKKQRVKNRV